MKAVVWTDTFQGIVYLAGLLAILITVSAKESGSSRKCASLNFNICDLYVQCNHGNWLRIYLNPKIRLEYVRELQPELLARVLKYAILISTESPFPS